MVHVSQHPLVKHKLTLLRHKATEPKKFRELIREVAILLAYEATADLSLNELEVTTPMGTARGYSLKEKIGRPSARRAGHGRWHLGDDARLGGLAHRPLPG